MKEVAFLIRNEILTSKVNKLPENLSTQHVIESECSVPALLGTFLENLLTARTTKNKAISDGKKRRIESIAHDAIYAVSNGRIRPAKHLTLALAMKNLTGSRRVLEVLNRFGHCVSYTAAEEIETELIYSAIEKSRLLPDGLYPLAHLYTGVCFDNFDLFMDTLTGKDTLHDTVGMVYQFQVDENLRQAIATPHVGPASLRSTPATRPHQPLRKRRRALEAEELHIQPYHKSLKLVTQTLTNLNDEIREEIAPSYQNAKLFDFVWQLCVALKVPNTPMWTGFNSKIVENKNPLQVVRYLPLIEASPTIDAVVLLTMQMALKVAGECQHISYSDSAICKKYFALQANESPKFDKIFVQLGNS